MKKITLILLLLIIYFSAFSQAWLPQISGTSNALYSVFFSKEDSGFAVGIGGTIKKTTDGGINWNTITSGLSTDLLDVKFADENTGYIVGRSGVILKTTDGGNSWNSVSPTNTPDFIRIFIIGNDIYVSGYYGPNGGIIIKSSNAGLSWTTLNTGTTGYLYSSFFTDIDTGYVVGYPGIILKTTNGGISWTAQTSGTSFQLISVFFTDSNNGFIAGGDISSSNSGIILKTIDGGATWVSEIFPNNYFGNIRFLDPMTGFVAGGSVTANTSTILKTNDSGTSWNLENSSSSRQYGLTVPSLNIGYSCGVDGTILKTTGLTTGLEEFVSNNFNTEIAPNPFNSYFTINFDSENDNLIEIRLFDIVGKECSPVINESLMKGTNHVEVKGLDLLDNGVYFVQIKAGKSIQTKKVVKAGQIF